MTEHPEPDFYRIPLIDARVIAYRSYEEAKKSREVIERITNLYNTATRGGEMSGIILTHDIGLALGLERLSD